MKRGPAVRYRVVDKATGPLKKIRWRLFCTFGGNPAMKPFDVMLMIREELDRVRSRRGPMHGPHEALARIRQEYLHLEREIFAAVDPVRARFEAIQLAAMAARFMVDCLTVEKGDVLVMIRNELDRATELHGSMHGPHEALGVIREEYLELERELFHGSDPAKAVVEAVQVAAMAARFVVDCIPGESGGRDPQ